MASQSRVVSFSAFSPAVLLSHSAIATKNGSESTMRRNSSVTGLTGWPVSVGTA